MNQRNSQEELSSCRCSTTSHVDQDKEKECESNARLVSFFAKRFGTGQWSFLGPGSEKSGILSVQIVHKVNGTELQRR